jgi:23S rRNA (cytosine1962-C5)-methyltransferase
LSPPTFCLKTNSPRLRIRLRPTAESLVRSGHPWVFSDSIREQSRPAEQGELAVLFDRKDKFLALALYDPDSPIRLRVIHRGKPVLVNAEWWRERMLEAKEKRSAVFDAETNAGRVINGENDGFPGLVLDRYDATCVLKLYSAVWFSRIPEILDAITATMKPDRVVLRLSRNIQSEASRNAPNPLRDSQVLVGEPPGGAVHFLESGLTFEADVVKGQKTGFFLDQRENRRRVGSLASGRTLLNAFSFSGGFSLYAARGGATSVTDVDISAHALESSRRNFALNQAVTSRCKHHLEQADVFEWLDRAGERRFDLIVLDPPSLAKRAADRAGALRAYSNLARAGIRLATRNGLVVCCSCSSQIKADEFFETVEGVFQNSGRSFEIIEKTRQPEDHPASFPEAEYLKAIYLRLR